MRYGPYEYNADATSPWDAFVDGASPFGETEEMEMAAEFLEIVDDRQVDLFLGKLMRRAVWRATINPAFDLDDESVAFWTSPTEELEASGQTPIRRKPARVNRRARSYVRWVQQSLNSVLGLRLREDGVFGPGTRRAVRIPWAAELGSPSSRGRRSFAIIVVGDGRQTV